MIERCPYPRRHNRSNFDSGEPIPCFRMGRLARDLRWRGEGIGSLLVGLAVERRLQVRQSVGGYALIVDAIGDASKSFYLHYSFQPYLDPPPQPLPPAWRTARPGQA